MRPQNKSLTWRVAIAETVLFSFLARAFFFFIGVAIYATRERERRGDVFLEIVAPTIALGVAFFIVTPAAIILTLGRLAPLPAAGPDRTNPPSKTLI